jgi:predicted transcriptional regulator YheO
MSILAFRLQVRHEILTGLYEHLQKAYAMGCLRLVKRIHALLYILAGKDVAEVASILKLSPQTIYNYLKAFMLHQLNSNFRFGIQR